MVIASECLNELNNSLHIVLLTLPNGLAALAAAMILLGEKPERLVARVGIFALLYPLFWIASFRYLASNPGLYYVNQFLQAIIVVTLCRLLITRYWSKALLIAAVFLTASTLIAMTSFLLELLLTGGSSSYFDLVPVWNIISFWWPADLIMVASACYVTRTRAGHLFRKLAQLSEQRPFIVVAICIVLQFIIVTGALTTASASIKYVNGTVSFEYTIVVISMLFFFISSLAILACVVSLAEDIAAQDFELCLSRQVADISLNLKARRHDFIHHVQVLAVLFQEGNLAEFRSYLQMVEQEMDSPLDSKSVSREEAAILAAEGQARADG